MALQSCRQNNTVPVGSTNTLKHSDPAVEDVKSELILRQKIQSHQTLAADAGVDVQITLHLQHWQHHQHDTATCILMYALLAQAAGLSCQCSNS